MPNNEVSIYATINLGQQYIEINSFQPDGGDGDLEFLAIYCMKCDKLFKCSHSNNKKIDHHFKKSSEHIYYCDTDTIFTDKKRNKKK